jgi:hypothetical protein
MYVGEEHSEEGVDKKLRKGLANQNQQQPYGIIYYSLRGNRC